MRKAVLWDFDGVLADTLSECHQVTQATLRASGAELRSAVGSLATEYGFDEFAGDRPTAVNAADFFAHYLSRRAFGTVEHDRLSLARKKFDALIKGLDGEYYLQRQRLATRLGGKYYEMLLPYPGVADALARLHSAGVSQAVMTARDSESVKGWLSHYRLSGLFERVVGTEVSRADRMVKRKQFGLLRQSLGAVEYYFVDDLAHNLEVVGEAAPEIRLVFAQWGYGRRPPRGALVAASPAGVAALAGA